MVKNLPVMQEGLASISGSGRSPGEGNGNPVQYSCLGNPWTGVPGRLWSTGSQRIKHNWATNTFQSRISGDFFFSHVLASMRSEMWRDVLLAVRHGLWIFLPHLSESYYTATHAVYPQPASCCRVCCLSWLAFLTLELQAVHPSVNPCINFHDSDVSNSAPSGVFDTSPMWLIASQRQPGLPSVCTILGTDTTVHPAAVSQHLRDMMVFLFLLCDI